MADEKRTLNGQAKRKWPANELSNQRCAHEGCTRRIKRNVVARKGEGKPLLCYEHWLARKKKT